MIEKIDKTFYELTGTRLTNTSQLQLFSILKSISENETFLNIFKSYSITSDIKENVFYHVYEVGNDEGGENISFKYYGTPNLGGIIAIINNVENPFEFLEEGINIYILKGEYIYQILKEIKNIGINL